MKHVFFFGSSYDAPRATGFAGRLFAVCVFTLALALDGCGHGEPPRVRVVNHSGRRLDDVWVRTQRDSTRVPSLKPGDSVEVRFEPREVYKTGKAVALSFKEFELLKYLIEHRGRTVSREELLEEIWGVDEDLGVTTRTVDTHVSNLRSKLGAGFAQPFIVAVHKVGYKFVEP